MRPWYAYGATALLVLATSACVTAPVTPLTESGHAFGQEEDEKKLIKRSDEADAELRRRGLVLQDAQIDDYVLGVARRLVPPEAATAVTFRFRVARDPLVNAFALPNGSIYLNVGLLARLESEAQLAHVLAHEIAHVVQRHGLQGDRNRRATIVAANVADLFLFGTSIAYLPAIGSLAWHSREAESEADRIALEYMARAGYPLDGAEKMFKLLEQVKQKESFWGSVYSSHPDNKQRAEATHEIISSGRLPKSVGTVVANPYTIRDALVLEDLRLKLNVRQYQIAMEAADRALARDPKSPWLHYYRGEALLRMVQDPEGAAREDAWANDKKYNDALIAEHRERKTERLATAREAFRQSLALDNDFAHAHRGLGLVAYADGDNRTAREALQRYLKNGKEITDWPYINNILGRLDNE